VMAKRLEKGTFAWPKATNGEFKRQLSPESLVLLLNGMDVDEGRMRSWFLR
jgi:transposase